ncbi:hypothetical protein ACJMK2_003762 [Sinanodonta woodiana]|uniref:Uncharacterized protein n=1 Tax=Sinanodonta woodiana TaxID=1069815 RepID=A0ABD3XZ74_SINWO
MSRSVTWSHRMNFLSQPKRLPASFKEDRRSVYWIDTNPPKAGEDGTTAVNLSPRLHELAKHTDPHRQWKCNRLSPVWTVTEAAKRTQPSDRILTLSEPKKLHAQFQYNRSHCIPMNLGARSTTATDRRCLQCHTIDHIDEYACNVSHSFHERVSNLIQFLAQRPVRRNLSTIKVHPVLVSKSGRTAFASRRMQQL